MSKEVGWNIYYVASRRLGYINLVSLFFFFQHNTECFQQDVGDEF